jgi:malic enzyme
VRGGGSNSLKQLQLGAENTLVLRFLSTAHARVFTHFRSSPACIKTATHKPFRLLTSLSDYPNQINNAFAFPVFRGALDVQARDINEAMKLAAAKALAESISPAALSEDYIIPSLFDKDVVPRMAKAVAAAARDTGVARRRSKLSDDFASR